MPLNLSSFTQLQRKEDSGVLWFLPSLGWRGVPPTTACPGGSEAPPPASSPSQHPCLSGWWHCRPPSRETLTLQGLQDQNHCLETAETASLVPHPVCDGWLQLLRVSKSPGTLFTPCPKCLVPERTPCPGSWLHCQSQRAVLLEALGP